MKRSSSARPLSIQGFFLLVAVLGAAAFLLFIGVIKPAIDEKVGTYGNYELANVEIVWGAAPSPDYHSTSVYNGSSWVPSKEDGQIVLTSKGPVLELVGDEEVVQAQVGYGIAPGPASGNHPTPAYGEFPWDGKSFVPPFRKVRAKNGKWFKTPLNDIEVLATTSRHPFQPEIPGTCVGAKAGFPCGVGMNSPFVGRAILLRKRLAPRQHPLPLT